VPAPPKRTRGGKPTKVPEKLAHLGTAPPSSFRDSTYTDQDFGGGPCADDESDNGIDHVFEGINRDLQSLTPAEESDVESESEFMNNQMPAGGGAGSASASAVGGKFYRQMSEQSAKACGGVRKTRTYPPKDAAAAESERKPKPPQRGKVQVAALEVHNVKKAISRYGTLPKGARIGAYLESLRQSGLTGEPPEGLDIDDDKDMELDNLKGHSSLLRQAVNKNQTSDRKLPSNSTTTKMVGDSGFRTPSPKPRHFRAQIRANQRDNSPAPNLADLEFPPPPPPLEDDTDDASQCSRSSGSRKDAAQLASGRPVPSPRASLTSAAAIGQPLKSSCINIQLRSSSADGFVGGREAPEEEQFVLGEEISIEENSLKKNIDSHRHAKSESSPNTTIDSTNSGGGFVTSKSADSLASDPVVDEMSSNAVMSQSMVGMLRSSSWDDNTTSTTPPEPAPTSNKTVVDKNGAGGSSLECLNPPSVNLVSELFENLRLKAGKKPERIDADANSKSALNPLNPSNSLNQGGKAPPKPTHPAPAPPGKKTEQWADDNCSGSPMKFDFKSRLRKVNASAGSGEEPLAESSSSLQGSQQLLLLPVTQLLLLKDEKSPEGSSQEDGNEDKRKSSGSINSLKRLWEKEKEQGKEQGTNRLSLKSIGASSDAVQVTTAKPAVAIKPSIRAKTTAGGGAGGGAAIYATPTSSVINSKPPPPPPPLASGSSVLRTAPATGVYARTNHAPVDAATSQDRLRIVNLCSEAEQMLSSSSTNATSPAQWTDVLSNVHSMSCTYADCIAPHGRFHFRQLVSKLESQSKEMKQTSSGPLRNSCEHSRLVGDVKNTLRDIANALQR